MKKEKKVMIKQERTKYVEVYMERKKKKKKMDFILLGYDAASMGNRIPTF